MMKLKTYVGVLTSMKDGGAIRYVTGTANRMAHWDADKPALPFAEQTAKEIVEGLNYNGYDAVIVKAPALMELRNPK